MMLTGLIKTKWFEFNNQEWSWRNLPETYQVDAESIDVLRVQCDTLCGA